MISVNDQVHCHSSAFLTTISPLLPRHLPRVPPDGHGNCWRWIVSSLKTAGASVMSSLSPALSPALVYHRSSASLIVISPTSPLIAPRMCTASDCLSQLHTKPYTSVPCNHSCLISCQPLLPPSLKQDVLCSASKHPRPHVLQRHSDRRLSCGRHTAT